MKIYINNTNAYELLSIAKQLISKLNLDLDFETVKTHMTQGDYDYLVDCFINYFQEEVEIVY